MKLIDYRIIKGKIRTKTGLRIGGSSDIIEIGGDDNPVIREGKSNEPYIPGSSLKGKIRALMEWYKGKVSDSGDPHACEDNRCFICRTFGLSAGENSVEFGPGRAIFRDAFLTEESREELEEIKRETGRNYTEIKPENTINRLDSQAMPRTMERVPAGVSFSFELIYKIFDLGDNAEVDKDNYEELKKGLKLLELDALGGSGSRGYGKVKFEDLCEIKNNEESEIELSEVNI